MYIFHLSFPLFVFLLLAQIYIVYYNMIYEERKKEKKKIGVRKVRGGRVGSYAASAPQDSDIFSFAIGFG